MNDPLKKKCQKNIYVIFDDGEFLAISQKLVDGDHVVGDMPFEPGPNIENFNLKLKAADEAGLASSTRELLQRVSRETDERAMCFANLIFDATIMPLFSYLMALKEAINSAKQKGFDPVVIFHRAVHRGRTTSALFMAEHESYFKLFYKRAEYIQPYLEKLVSDELVGTQYIKRRKRRNSLTFSVPARRLFVYFGRFFLALLKKSHFDCSGLLINKEERRRLSQGHRWSFVVITRTPSQSDYVVRLTGGMTERFLIIAGETSLAFDRNMSFLRTGAAEHVDAIKLPSASWREIFSVYWYALKKTTTMFRARLWYSQMSVDLTDAIKEAFVLIPDLVLYRKSLISVISDKDIISRKLLTFELKSQYAFADADVARQVGLSPIQLLECDLLPRSLPIPIAGDHLVVDSEVLAGKYKEVWRESSSRIHCFGDTKVAKSSSSISGLPVLSRYCFFSSDNYSFNKKALVWLKSLLGDAFTRLIIKKHPRDKFPYRAFGLRNVIYNEGDIEKNVLMEAFDFAFAPLRSSVHSYLIHTGKLFLFIDIYGDFTNPSPFEQFYKKLTVRSEKDLQSVFKDLIFIREECDRLRSEYSRGSRAISSKMLFEQLSKLSAG